MGIPIKLEVFEGPLDLLLHLIDKNKVDIYDIPIVEITNQYMEYIHQMQREDLNIILYGSKDKLNFVTETRSGSIQKSYDYFEGIISNLERRYMETNSEFIRDWIGQFMVENVCDTCHGKKLIDGILSVYINKKNRNADGVLWYARHERTCLSDQCKSSY